MSSNKHKRVPRLFFVSIFVLSFHIARSQTIMQKLSANKRTSHFAQSLIKTNLNNRLNGPGPYTILAPTNKAFDKLSDSQKEDDKLLLNHIFTGMATERSLKAMNEVTCLSGKTIKLKKINGGKSLTVGSYAIVTTNIKADNGVIHIINGVIK